MWRKMLVIIIVVFVQFRSVDGQSSIGSSDAIGLNLVDEMQSMILDEIRHLQNRDSACSSNCPKIEDVLFRHLNNMTETLNSLSNRFEALDRNVQKGGASLEGLQLKLSSNSQIEDLMGQHLNNVTQTFQSLSNWLEAIDQKHQIGSESIEGLQINFQNLSKLYEDQVKILGTVQRKLEEHDQYFRNQSAASISADKDGRESRPWSRDCAEIRKMGQSSSGVYQVSSLGSDSMPIEISVYCDMSSSGESWLVFQRRKDGSENFERTWIEYRNGFGNLRGEFWLGNNALHVLTSNRNYKLRIEMEDFDGDKRFAEYTHFATGPAADNYRLNISGYSGNAGDSMTQHHGQMFSTKDADHDNLPDQNCAQVYHGAWWYYQCHAANLNGLYLRGNHTSFADGIEWLSFRGYHHSLKIVEMKIAPRN